MAWVVLKPNEQKPGALVGGFWVVLQAWPIASLYTIALLGPEGMRIEESYGEWEVIKRPRDVGITEWTGRRNFTASLDVLYDGWVTHVARPRLPTAIRGIPRLPGGATWSRQGVWIEGQIDSLEQMARIQRDQTAPPSMRIYGAVPHPEVRWVIQSIDWGDCIRDEVTGRRMRQQATIHLLEYHQPSELQRLPRGKADPKKTKK